MSPRTDIDFTAAFGASDDPKLYIDTWLNKGFNAPTQKTFKFDDLLATPNMSVWMPKVIEEFVREPVEPMIVAVNLLDRIQHTGAVKISMPVIGSLVAFDIGELMSYPEQTLNLTPGTMTVNIGKVGLAFSMSEEVRRYSQFDVMGLWLRRARQALDRKQEKKAMDFISGLGVVLFDNKNPTESVYGTCTGRSITGAANGSARMEDLLKAYAHIMMQGYLPNTIMIHPMAWTMWMQDPLLQTIMKNTGDGNWFQPVNIPQQSNPFRGSKLGGYGNDPYVPGQNAAGETPTPSKDLDQLLKTAPVIPSYFPRPLTVVVTPFAPYDPERGTCDIMLFDRSNLGALIEDEPITMSQWEDQSVDAIKIKLRTRYGFAIYDEGLAVGVMKNVPIRANEIAFPIQSTISSSGSIEELDVTVPIPGL